MSLADRYPDDAWSLEPGDLEPDLEGPARPQLAGSAPAQVATLAAYDRLPAMVQLLDQAGCLRYVNRHWLDRLGYRSEAVLGQPFARFLGGGEADPARQAVLQMLAAGAACRSLPCLLLDQHGRPHPARIALEPLPDQRHGAPWLLAVLTEAAGAAPAAAIERADQPVPISPPSALPAPAEGQQRALLGALAASHEQLALALHGAGAGLFDIDLAAGRVTYNDRAATMLGHAPGTLPDRLADLGARIHPADRAAVQAAQAAHLQGQSEFFSVEHRQRRQDGGWLWVAALGRIMAWDAAGQPLRLVGIMIDISERKRSQLAIEHRALHDPLTELPNRAYFWREFERLRAAAGRRRMRFALMLIDVDRFKQINDSFGHLIGDGLLVEVGRRLRASVRVCDLVARLGGDEFAVLAAPAFDPASGAQLAERILASFAAPCLIQGCEIQANISIGLSLCPDHGIDPEQLQLHADAALYAAKGAGRARWRAYDGQQPASWRQGVGWRPQPSSPAGWSWAG